MFSPLFLLILIPLAGVAAIIFRVPPRRSAIFSVVLPALLLGGLASFNHFGANFIFAQTVPWLEMQGLGRIVFRIGLDGVSFPLALLTAIVSVSAVLVVPPQIEREREHYAFLLVIVAGLYGTFISTDLFFMFVFHELALIPTFLAIGIWGQGTQHKRVQTACHVAVYLLLGSLVLLAGILGLIYAMPYGARTTDWIEIQSYLSRHPIPVGVQKAVFPLLYLGFGILVGIFPFHTWAPKAYATAPASVAMLHAGVLKKFGLYGLLRVAMPFFPEGAAYWEPWLVVLIAGNLLVLGWVTLAQDNLGDTIGYSSVMHMGYLFLGLLAFTPVALTGVVLLMVGHGLSVSGLLVMNGVLLDRTGTNRYALLGGIGKTIPFLGAFFVLMAMASIGLPGLGNFPGEILIFMGSWEKHPWLVVAALFGVLISTIYMLRAVRSIFMGEAGSSAPRLNELYLVEKGSLVLLASALLVLGFAPRLLSHGAAEALASWIGKGM